MEQLLPWSGPAKTALLWDSLQGCGGGSGGGGGDGHDATKGLHTNKSGGGNGHVHSSVSVQEETLNVHEPTNNAEGTQQGTGDAHGKGAGDTDAGDFFEREDI
jgi:hypothetical protein